MRKPKNFDLGVYCFPGGTVYANRAVTGNGDYQNVAFVDHMGKVRFDVPVEAIPGPVLLRIEHDANATHENFKTWYDRKSDMQKYSWLMDRASIRQILGAKGTLQDKIAFLEKEQRIF